MSPDFRVGASTHPTAPGPSCEDLKTHTANFMRRAEVILAHPLAKRRPGLSLTVHIDNEGRPVGSGTLDHQNVDAEALVHLASRMRPIIYLRDDPISLEHLTGLIEREHEGFRGKLKPFRLSFLEWLKQPIIYSGTIGEVPPELRTDSPPVTALASARSGTPLPIHGLSGDMRYTELFFYGEVWHSDVQKAAEYEAASRSQREFIAKCAELRTFGAIPFIRTIHDRVVEVRAKGMDI